MAHGLVQHGMPSVVDQRHGAGQKTLVHMGLEHGAQAGEGGGVHGGPDERLWRVCKVFLASGAIG
ncbi:hypothetical protein D3C71_2041560 [compost metagenome]